MRGAPDRVGTGAAVDAAVAAGFLVLAVLLGQHGFYHVDGQGLVLGLARAEVHHDRHPLFLPIARVLAAPLLALGVSPFRCLTLVSALGTACGLFALGRAAARLAVPARERAVLLLAIAACPSVLFFATVVEFHGLFLAFAALAWRAAVGLERWLAQPDGSAVEAGRRRGRVLGAGAVLGVATAVAAMVHGFGQLLIVVLPCWVVARRGRDWRGALAPLAVACATHVALGLAVSVASGGAGGRQLGYFAPFLADLAPVRELAAGLVDEWLLAFLPLSLTCFLVAGRARERLVLGLAVAGYLVLTWILTPGLSERGAYLHPLVFPAAVLALASPRRLLLVLVAAGLALGVLRVRSHDAPVAGVGSMQAVVAVAEERPSFLLLASSAEEDPLLMVRPALPYLRVAEFLATMPAGGRAEAVHALLARLSSDQAGLDRRLLATRAALEALQAATGEVGSERLGALRVEVRRAGVVELRP
ncbi:MAG: hypothetical protein R3F30_14690 [Planctomycetota bacterium]